MFAKSITAVYKATFKASKAVTPLYEIAITKKHLVFLTTSSLPIANISLLIRNICVIKGF